MSELRNGSLGSNVLGESKKQQASEEILKRDNCFCCDKYKFYNYSTLTVFAADCVQLSVQLYYVFQYSFDTQEKDFQKEFLDELDDYGLTEEQYDRTLKELELHFVLIMLPLTIFLIVKMLYGLRWIRAGYTRPTLSTYFMYSWAFYTSFMV